MSDAFKVVLAMIILPLALGIVFVLRPKRQSTPAGAVVVERDGKETLYAPMTKPRAHCQLPEDREVIIRTYKVSMRGNWKAYDERVRKLRARDVARGMAVQDGSCFYY